MGEIVNLRQARKVKARADAAQAADANRVRFGRSKAETQATAAQEALTAKRLDGHRRDLPDADA